MFSVISSDELLLDWHLEAKRGWRTEAQLFQITEAANRYTCREIPNTHWCCMSVLFGINFNGGQNHHVQGYETATVFYKGDTNLIRED